jgi:hypothetical protein
MGLRSILGASVAETLKLKNPKPRKGLTEYTREFTQGSKVKVCISPLGWGVGLIEDDKHVTSIARWWWEAGMCCDYSVIVLQPWRLRKEQIEREARELLRVRA